MSDWPIVNFLDTHDLMPHGMCLTWRTDLLWLHATSDLFTAISYFSIPIALLVFAWRRRDLKFRWMFVLFGIFITACGATHVMALWTLWVPDYLAEGIVKAITAVSSVATASILYPLIPKALALPGPAQWEAVNANLRNEVSERRDAEEKLHLLNVKLEERVQERTAELESANRKLAEANQALRAEVETRRRVETHIRRLIDSNIIGILFWNLDGRITEANDAFLSLVGYSRQDLLSGAVRWADMTPPEYRAADQAAIDELMSLGSCRPFEKEYVGKDGRRVPVLMGGALFEGSQDKGVAFVLDLTERKAAEQEVARLNASLEERVRQRTAELEAAKRRLEGVTNNLFEGVLVLDGNGVVTFANPAARRLLHDREELEGAPIDSIFHLRRDDRDVSFLENGLPGVAWGVYSDHDALFATSGGKVLSVAYACSPLKGEPRDDGAIISFRDIGALKAAQREAMQTSRLASVGQLAAGIAHEINTPMQYVGDNLRFIQDSLTSIGKVLTGVAASLEHDEQRAGTVEELRVLFRDGEIPYLLDELPLATSQALEGADHVSHIVRSMKEFSHPGTTTKTAMDVNRAVDSTITVSRNEWRTVAKVETDLDPTLPSVVCFPADINQVLLNLIVNAAHAIESLEASTPGTIRITTRRAEGYVEIRVTDTGPGVPPAIRDRIFDPFFTTKTVGKGTGQGLSICYESIVKKHGGQIFLDDNDGPGAAFMVRLPLRPVDA